jgi:hypothetical protein
VTVLTVHSWLRQGLLSGKQLAEACANKSSLKSAGWYSRRDGNHRLVIAQCGAWISTNLRLTPTRS